MRAHIAHMSKEDFLLAFFKAYTKAIMPEIIWARFKATGLFSFDLQVVILQLDVAQGRSTSLLAPELPPTP